MDKLIIGPNGSLVEYILESDWILRFSFSDSVKDELPEIVIYYQQQLKAFDESLVRVDIKALSTSNSGIFKTGPFKVFTKREGDSLLFVCLCSKRNTDKEEYDRGYIGVIGDSYSVDQIKDWSEELIFEYKFLDKLLSPILNSTIWEYMEN